MLEQPIGDVGYGLGFEMGSFCLQFPLTECFRLPRVLFDDFANQMDADPETSSYIHLRLEVHLTSPDNAYFVIFRQVSSLKTLFDWTATSIPLLLGVDVPFHLLINALLFGGKLEARSCSLIYILFDKVIHGRGPRVIHGRGLKVLHGREVVAYFDRLLFGVIQPCLSTDIQANLGHSLSPFLKLSLGECVFIDLQVIMGLLKSLWIEVDIERLVILLIILQEGSLCIHDVYLQRVRFQAEQVIILQEPDSSPAEVAIQIMSFLPELLNIFLVLPFIIGFISIFASNSAKQVRPYFRNSLKHF